MTDSVFITQLETEAVIGVYDWERTIKQRLVIDLELFCDQRRAADTDDLQYALDYFSISEAVKALVAASSYQLIEALAEAIAQMINQEFKVEKLVVAVHKPGAVPDAKTVGVKITRDYGAIL